MSEKQKYVQVNIMGTNSFIIFPMAIDHDTFKSMSPTSAGFLEIDSKTNKVICFGGSHTLNIGFLEADSFDLTVQVFGMQEAMKAFF